MNLYALIIRTIYLSSLLHCSYYSALLFNIGLLVIMDFSNLSSLKGWCALFLLYV